MPGDSPGVGGTGDRGGPLCLLVGICLRYISFHVRVCLFHFCLLLIICAIRSVCIRVCAFVCVMYSYVNFGFVGVLGFSLEWLLIVAGMCFRRLCVERLRDISSLKSVDWSPRCILWKFINEDTF